MGLNRAGPGGAEPNEVGRPSMNQLTMGASTADSSSVVINLISDSSISVPLITPWVEDIWPTFLRLYEILDIQLQVFRVAGVDYFAPITHIRTANEIVKQGVRTGDLPSCIQSRRLWYQLHDVYIPICCPSDNFGEDGEMCIYDTFGIDAINLVVGGSCYTVLSQHIAKVNTHGVTPTWGGKQVGDTYNIKSFKFYKNYITTPPVVVQEMARMVGMEYHQDETTSNWALQHFLHGDLVGCDT